MFQQTRLQVLEIPISMNAATPSESEILPYNIRKREFFFIIGVICLWPSNECAKSDSETNTARCYTIKAILCALNQL